MATGQVGSVLSALGATAVRVDGDVPVRLPRRARHAARTPADSALRVARRQPASRRLADAAQSAPPSDGARKVRRVPRENQHGSFGRHHRHGRRCKLLLTKYPKL